jgi:hypothetical protein
MIDLHKKNVHTRILTPVVRCDQRSVGLTGVNEYEFVFVGLVNKCSCS